jgi:hypothetical protein
MDDVRCDRRGVLLAQLEKQSDAAALSILCAVALALALCIIGLR